MTGFASRVREAAGNALGTLAQKVCALQLTFRQLGFQNGVLYQLDRLLAVVSGDRIHLRKYYFVAQPVSTKPLLAARRGANLEVRRLLPGDPVLLVVPRPQHIIRFRFDQDAICLAILAAERCIGCLWFTLGPYTEDEVRCRYVPLPEGQASWDFDVYLEPESRNGIAFLKLWDEANKYLAERQIRYSLSRISAFNSVSMLSHARMGARRIGTAVFLSAGSWQLSAASVPPYFDLSVSESTFPTFILVSEPRSV